MRFRFVFILIVSLVVLSFSSPAFSYWFTANGFGYAFLDDVGQAFYSSIGPQVSWLPVSGTYTDAVGIGFLEGEDWVIAFSDGSLERLQSDHSVGSTSAPSGLTGVVLGVTTFESIVSIWTSTDQLWYFTTSWNQMPLPEDWDDGWTVGYYATSGTNHALMTGPGLLYWFRLGFWSVAAVYPGAVGIGFYSSTILSVASPSGWITTCFYDAVGWFEDQLSPPVGLTGVVLNMYTNKWDHSMWTTTGQLWYFPSPWQNPIPMPGGAIAVEPATWGKIKSLYSDSPQ